MIYMHDDGHHNICYGYHKHAYKVYIVGVEQLLLSLILYSYYILICLFFKWNNIDVMN